MARYNQWQNSSLCDLVDGMDGDALHLERGAYFGSIFATLNHLMWGDRIWMSRFDPSVEAPETVDKGISLTSSATEWSAERRRLDSVILEWAYGLQVDSLEGEIRWYSKIYDTEFMQSKALCVMHFFNHQTHHRGQIHAMMTAAGQSTIDTDLPFMPEN